MSALRLRGAGLAALLLGLTSGTAAAQRVVEVQVAPAFVRMRPGTQVAVLATAYDRDGMPVDAKLVWRSTNINVATVDSNGAVVALAPGLAVITASTDSTRGPRRHYGRTTVLVIGNEGWPRVNVPNLPAMPGMDDKRLLQPGDTIQPSECADPDVGMRNPGRECWDIPPHHPGPAFLDPPASCVPPITPPIFQVRVEPDGHVSNLRTLNESTCKTYQSAATDFVRGLTFFPARRNGRTVAAWGIVTVRSVQMRMYLPMPVLPTVPPTDTAPPPPGRRP